MKTDLLRNHCSKALLLSFFLSTSAGFAAQGLTHAAPVPHQPTVAKRAAPQTKAPASAMQKSNAPAKAPAKVSADVHKRVAVWFGKYDAIRHAAQMNPTEKSNAHKLMTAVLTNNDGDKAQARQLLTKMISRYDRASASLSALGAVPETAALQQGYLRYFKTARNFFNQYLLTMKKNVDPASMNNLQNARKNLTLLDMSNKLLDKKLRKQYNIPPYKW